MKLTNLWDDMTTIKVNVNGKTLYRKARKDLNDNIYVIISKTEYYINK